MPSLFLPGWGAPGALYAAGLPAGWRALEPPRLGRAEPTFEAYLAWLLAELDAQAQPVAVAGHSMGGALALAAAARAPDRVRRLVLVSPAGLPLLKPIGRSLADFALQLARRRYPARQAAPAIVAACRAPRAAWRLADSVRRLDLSAEMRRVRAAAIETTVVGCTTDTLVTASHCRRAAALLGARYRELQLAGGHMWMLDAWPRLVAELAAVDVV
jgi:pimeloyl-ACP methyl ester carboxylesterase